MKITLADITIRTREVELPEKCPDCGALDSTSYMICALEYQYYDSELNDEGKLVRVRNPEHIDCDPEYPYTGVFCGKCGGDLVLGQVTRIPTPPTPEEARQDAMVIFKAIQQPRLHQALMRHFQKRISDA